MKKIDSYLPINVLDIGADTDSELGSRWDAMSEYVNVVSVEPRQTSEGQLPIFLGDGKRRTFYETEYGPCSSFFKPNKKLLSQFYGVGVEDDHFAIKSKKTIDTHKLDDVDLGVKAVDWLKLDIQGSEAMVLKNAKKTLANSLVVEIEVSFIELYEKAPLFADVDKIMRREGFIFHRFVDFDGRCIKPTGFTKSPRKPMSQMWQADAVYTRDWTKYINVYESNDLLKMHSIMVDGYDSWDLGARLLKEFDDRNGSNLFQNFLDKKQISFQFLREKYS